MLDDVSKAFRVFSERNQSIKQALLRRKRGKYDDFWALRDVSLSVKEGTTFGIIGIKCWIYRGEILDPNASMARGTTTDPMNEVKVERGARRNDRGPRRDDRR